MRKAADRPKRPDVNFAPKKPPAVKLNRAAARAFLRITDENFPGGIVNEETQALIDRWIMTFCEAPILIDPELMQRVLADQEASDQRDRS